MAAAGAGCVTRSRAGTPNAGEAASAEQQKHQQQQQAPTLMRKRQQREVNGLLAVIGRYKASGVVQTEDLEDQAKVTAHTAAASMHAMRAIP